MLCIKKLWISTVALHLYRGVFQVNNSLAAMKKAGKPYVRAPHVGTSPGPRGLEESLENAEDKPHVYSDI